jgi:hypothetical protein
VSDEEDDERRPTEVERFERQLRRALGAQHTCDCDVCALRQRHERFDTALRWGQLRPDEQEAWLAEHDELDETMRAWLSEAADDGLDLVGFQVEANRLREQVEALRAEVDELKRRRSQ